jgi:hypothetical protein
MKRKLAERMPKLYRILSLCFSVIGVTNWMLGNLKTVKADMACVTVYNETCCYDSGNAGSSYCQYSACMDSNGNVTQPFSASCTSISVSCNSSGTCLAKVEDGPLGQASQTELAGVENITINNTNLDLHWS